MPEYLVDDVQGRRVVAERGLAGFSPWGLSARAVRRFRHWQDIVVRSGKSVSLDQDVALQHQLSRKSYAQELVAEFLAGEGDVLPDHLSPTTLASKVCSHLDHIESALANWRLMGLRDFVIKADFGASGRNSARLFDEELNGRALRWVTRMLEEQDRVVVEPWLERA